VLVPVVAVALVWCAGPSLAAAELSAETRRFVSVDSAVVAITHVQLIDGTGAAARPDQTLVISRGRIQALGAFNAVQIPVGAKVLERPGYTVFPGIVGMHNHLFETAWVDRDPSGRVLAPGTLLTEIAFSAPRLYLAAGVTTLRTAGSIEGFTDLEIQRRIEQGKLPGPKMDVTGPYLEGPEGHFPQMHVLSGPEDARRMVEFWADEGATSFKAYEHITRKELEAIIQAAHRRGLKVTGHLCSITWPEAIAAGIDALEHGPVFTDTEFYPAKKADECPDGRVGTEPWAAVKMDGPEVKALIGSLVSHRVAVTSTLAVVEAATAAAPPNPRALRAMAPHQREMFLTARANLTPEAAAKKAALLEREMKFEFAFAAAGGLLMAGPDPTGNGGTLPGFGDWREIELLVAAGFTPVQAIHVATENGARHLGRQERIGTLAVGKDADLVLIRGDPTRSISDVENVETVFKDGVGYDSAALLESVQGIVGLH
jgi:imidazolonepropionase-like amidohydrolase